ncbi:MAG: molybdenum cofactor biosynthesis protein MoeB [Euryarchaeota archaeon]|nr:molybdenum cofactor biosynthesis protein MoeB [Euryarchaeota archaeon]|tara:strand:- start:1088 stop:2239 length:1152 start_codon:yes stop_codon:yes gene_type:complete
MVDINRYARHISLPDVGLEGQRKINQSRVLVIGAGGLGSPVLLYLAAAGVGRIGIIDDDNVELSNLQRQVIHSESKIGNSKSDSAKLRIESINSSIDVVTWSERLTPDNAAEIFSDWDLVIDGTDNIPTRYLVDDMCKILGIPWVYGSIYRFEGQVSVFNYHDGPCYRDLFPEPPPSNAIPSCAEGGVFGVLPGVIGAIQATEAIKIVLGRGEVLSGKLLLYDGDIMNFKTLNFSKSADSSPNLSQVREMFEQNGWCTTESSNDSEIHEPSTVGSGMFHHLSAKQYKEKKSDGWNPYLIDVRSAVEFQQIRISFTDLHVSHEEILSHVSDIPEERDVILLCRSGMRSQMAAMFLIDAGFDGQKLYNFDGGIIAWSNEIPEDIL